MELKKKKKKGKTGPFLTRRSHTPKGDALDEVKHYFIAPSISEDRKHK